MRGIKVCLLLVLCCNLLIGCMGYATGDSPEPANELFFSHATVVDVRDGSLLPDQSVVVEGSRIRAVGPSSAVAVPAGAQVVNARGKYLIPGLWDMHPHVFSNDASPGTDHSTWAFPLYVANGVTRVRDMWTDPDDIAVARRWNQERARGRLLAPHLAWSSEIVDGAPPDWRHAIGLANPEEARYVVRELAEEGAGFIKIYWNLPRDVFLALADEANKIGIPFAGHVPTAVGGFEASDAGMRSIEHLTGVLETCSTHAERFRRTTRGEWTREHSMLMWETFDEARCAELIARFARNGTWQTPTLLQTQSRLLAQEAGLASSPALAYVPAFERERWGGAAYRAAPLPVEVRRARFARFLGIVGDMQRAGVGILAGTDVGNPLIVPGFSLHEELALLAEGGLSPLQALQAATLNPARFFETTDSLGTVEAGKLADLVLLEANPLEDIRNTQRIVGVVLNGRYLDRRALDALLVSAEAESEAGRQ